MVSGGLWVFHFLGQSIEETNTFPVEICIFLLLTFPRAQYILFYGYLSLTGIIK